MATPDPNDPTQQQQPPTPPGDVPPTGGTPQPQQSTSNDFTGAWRSWMGDPQNRASLMQFGISMLQPVGVGQSQLGHFGQAVGQAGEAATRVQQQDMAKQKLAAETDYREQSANLAASRAEMTGRNLGLQQELFQLKQLLGTQTAAEKAHEAYQKAKIFNDKLTFQQYLEELQQYPGMSVPVVPGTSASGAPAGADGVPTQVRNGITYYYRNGTWWNK